MATHGLPLVRKRSRLADAGRNHLGRNETLSWRAVAGQKWARAITSLSGQGRPTQECTLPTPASATACGGTGSKTQRRPLVSRRRPRHRGIPGDLLAQQPCTRPPSAPCCARQRVMARPGLPAQHGSRPALCLWSGLHGAGGSLLLPAAGVVGVGDVPLPAQAAPAGHSRPDRLPLRPRRVLLPRVSSLRGPRRLHTAPCGHHGAARTFSTSPPSPGMTCERQHCSAQPRPHPHPPRPTLRAVARRWSACGGPPTC